MQIYTSVSLYISLQIVFKHQWKAFQTYWRGGEGACVLTELNAYSTLECKLLQGLACVNTKK